LRPRTTTGALLLAAALRQFRGRPKPGQEAAMPKWMNGIAGFAPDKSLLVGVGIGALNPKNIIVGVAAAVAIASASLSTGQELGASAVYVLVAVLGVAAPLVVMLAMGEKAQPILDKWKAWLGQNNAAVMSVLFLVFAVVLIGKGIEGI
jgi:threonine/homoserine/homoserine lactone efflux protein